MRNRCPTEYVFDTLPACIAEAFALFRILEKLVEARRQILCEFFGIARKAGYGILIERNQVSRFIVNHYLFDAPCRAGNHGSTTRHRFEVNDAEGLINRRAAEYTRMAIKLDGLLPRDHLLNPDNPRMILASRVYFLAKLGCNLRRIGSTRAQN